MTKDIARTMAAIDYIEGSLSEKLDLEVVSRAVHYSKYYLHRTFTATVGMTIHDYVQRRKLTEAARLLVFSDKPLMEIALIGGYESQQAFTGMFKEMYKKTPGQYREGGQFYPLQLRYILNGHPAAAADKGIDWEKDIRFASMEDIPGWLGLVRLVVDGFPCLNEEEYILRLKEYIGEKQALILKDNDLAVGVMGIARGAGSIDFLGVHPQYRRQGISRAFLRKAFSLLKDSAEIAVTTFREGDKADPGYRRAFQKLGFAEAQLLTEYGYPTQRLVLRREELEGSGNE